MKIYFLSHVLTDLDKENIKYYEIFYFSDNLLVPGEEYLLSNNKAYYYNMYDYEQINEIKNVKYYYKVLERRISKFNYVLDFIIEVGEKNA